jgi:hypothetical protein
VDAAELLAGRQAMEMGGLFPVLAAFVAPGAGFGAATKEAPGFAVSSILGFGAVGRKDEAGASASGGEGNDVPDVGLDDVDGEEVNAVAGVEDVAGGDVAFVGARAAIVRTLHLDAQEVSVVLDREVVGRGFSPGLGDAKAVLGGASHEAQFRPFPPKLGVRYIDIHKVFGEQKSGPGRWPL